MKIICGLGNPGVRYENTRHNAGFMVLDQLAKDLELDFTHHKFSGVYAKGKIDGEDVILLKPETFMNDSGFSLRQCMDFYKVSTEDVLVVYDDVDTPVGSLRLRQKGSAGGHNGIKSIINCIFTDQFDRIRVGIGKDAQIPMVNWVLGKFTPEEKPNLDKSVQEAAKAARCYLKNGFITAMNRYNKKAVKKNHEQKN